jgi:endoglucanase Acf2
MVFSLLPATGYAVSGNGLQPVSSSPFADSAHLQPTVPIGNSNGLSPIEAYPEYSTGGSPVRNPVPWTIVNNGKISAPTAYQTTKWYTDLTFSAMQRGKLYDDFRVAQSPFNIQIIDTALYNDAGTLISLPGLAITAPKKPYLAVNSKPSPLKIAGDIYSHSLLVDSTIDFAFSIPYQIATDPSYQIGRKIIVDNDINKPTTDQLSFTTEWTVSQGGNTVGSMTTPIVRGSPYITMSYQNLPLVLSGSNLLAAAVDNNPPDTVPDHPLDQPYTATGSKFELVIGGIDHNACNQKNYYDQGGNQTCPSLYNVYVLYTSSPITLKFNPSLPNRPFPMLVDNQPFTGIARLAYAGSFSSGQVDQTPTLKAVALLKGADPGSNDLKERVAILDTYANVYPVGAEVNYAYSPDYSKGQIIFNWKIQQFNQTLGNGQINSNNELLMAAFESTHLQNLQQGNDGVQEKSTLVFNTLRGPMVGVVGNQWVQNLNLPLSSSENALWYGAQPINPSYLPQLKSTLQQDIQLVNVDPTKSGNTLDPTNAKNDSYAFGKRLARLARLALIADQMGDHADAKIVINKMESAIAPWLQGGNKNDPSGMSQGYFKYDDKFGGIITARAATDPAQCPKDQCGYNLDFYNGMYTDHHFHYGYFLYSAAVIAKLDPSWAKKYSPEVNLLARDIANPSNQDTYFPVLRMFDVFEGHGFANGLGPNAAGRNQESSSEAVNAWYGLALWGDAIGNVDMKALGLIMTAQEIQATKAWVQIIPGKSIYDDYTAKSDATMFNPTGQDVSMQDDGATGINWSLKVDHSTFFGNKLGYILGIQMLPYTPITSELFSKEWVDANQQVLQTALGGLTNQIALYTHPETIIAQYPLDNLAGDNWSGYWGAFQSAPNIGYQWSLLVKPILALGSNQTDLYNAIFNEYPQQMQAVNEAFIAAGKGGSSSVKMTCAAGVSDPYQCYFAVKATQLPGGWQNVGMPLAYANYNGSLPNSTYLSIDNGLTLSNLVWWLGTHSQEPLPPPSYQFYIATTELQQAVNGTTLQANWKAINTYPNAKLGSFTVDLLNNADGSIYKSDMVNNDQQTVSFENVLPGDYYAIVSAAKDSMGNSLTKKSVQSNLVTVKKVPVPPAKAAYYWLVPNYRNGKADILSVAATQGIEVVTSQTPPPPGAVTLAVTFGDQSTLSVPVTVTDVENTSAVATCVLVMDKNGEGNTIVNKDSVDPRSTNCNVFGVNSNQGGTLQTPAVIGISTPLP